MSRRDLLAIALALVAVSLGGCANPDAGTRNGAEATSPASPGEPPAPAPTPPRRRRTGRGARDSRRRRSRRSRRATSTGTTGRSAQTQRALAASAVGSARAAELQAAASSRRDATISAAKISNSGAVLSVSPGAGRSGRLGDRDPRAHLRQRGLRRAAVLRSRHPRACRAGRSGLRGERMAAAELSASDPAASRPIGLMRSIGRCYTGLWAMTLLTSGAVALLAPAPARSVIPLSLHGAPPASPSRAGALFAHNLPVAAWPLGLPILGVHTRALTRRLADGMLLASAAGEHAACRARPGRLRLGARGLRSPAADRVGLPRRRLRQLARPAKEFGDEWLETRLAGRNRRAHRSRGRDRDLRSAPTAGEPIGRHGKR